VGEVGDTDEHAVNSARRE